MKVAIAALLTFACAGLAVADATPFLGESLTYRLRWGAITAGTATFTAETATEPELADEPAVSLTMAAKTTKFLDKIYKVRDTIRAVAAQDLSRTLVYKKDQQEGGEEKDLTVSFDWDKMLVQRTEVEDERTKERDPLEIVEGTLDPLSLFYRIRTMELKAGDVVKMPLTDGKRFNHGTATVVKRETIKLRGKKVAAILVEPDTGNLGGVFKKSKNAKLQIWFSDTDACIPLMFKSKVKVGSFTGELIAMNPPDGPDNDLETLLGSSKLDVEIQD